MVSHGNGIPLWHVPMVLPMVSNIPRESSTKWSNGFLEGFLLIKGRPKLKGTSEYPHFVGWCINIEKSVLFFSTTEKKITKSTRWEISSMYPCHIQSSQSSHAFSSHSRDPHLAGTRLHGNSGLFRLHSTARIAPHGAWIHKPRYTICLSYFSYLRSHLGKQLKRKISSSGSEPAQSK